MVDYPHVTSIHILIDEREDAPEDLEILDSLVIDGMRLAMIGVSDVIWQCDFFSYRPAVEERFKEEGGSILIDYGDINEILAKVGLQLTDLEGNPV